MDDQDHFGPFSPARMEPAQVIPASPAVAYEPPVRNELASQMVDRLAEWTARFQANLNDAEEVGAVLSHFGRALTIRLTGFGYHNPGLVAIYGDTDEAGECELLQHFTQVNLLLVRLPVPEGREVRRFAFLDEAAEDDGDPGI